MQGGGGEGGAARARLTGASPYTPLHPLRPPYTPLHPLTLPHRWTRTSPYPRSASYRHPYSPPSSLRWYSTSSLPHGCPHHRGRGRGRGKGRVRGKGRGKGRGTGRGKGRGKGRGRGASLLRMRRVLYPRGACGCGVRRSSDLPGQRRRRTRKPCLWRTSWLQSWPSCR